MSEQKLLSVIVPVYGVEIYLEKCVRSILAQTYRNLEIILVDDGSPDRCPEMCDAFAAEDERVVVIHKENGGLSSARNAGIEIARGEYIGFVDSDDYILPEMYSVMCNALCTQNADICICSYQKVDEEGKKIATGGSPIQNQMFTQKQILEKLGEAQNWYYVITPTKLYKAEILKKVRFEEGRLHEDEFFVHRVFGQCNRVVTISDAFYMYVQRKGSITHTKTARHYLCVTDAFWDRYICLKQYGYPSLAVQALISSYGRLVNWLNSSQTVGYERQIRERTYKISKVLVKHSVLRALKLWCVYIRFLRKEKK